MAKKTFIFFLAFWNTDLLVILKRLEKGCNFPTFISTCLLVKIPRIYPSRLILRWIEAFWGPNSSPRDFFGSIPTKVLWSFWKLCRYRNNSLDKKPIGFPLIFIPSFSREKRNKPFSTTTISLKRGLEVNPPTDKLYILLGSRNVLKFFRRLKVSSLESHSL